MLVAVIYQSALLQKRVHLHLIHGGLDAGGEEQVVDFLDTKIRDADVLCHSFIYAFLHGSPGRGKRYFPQAEEIVAIARKVNA